MATTEQQYKTKTKTTTVKNYFWKNENISEKIFFKVLFFMPLLIELALMYLLI